MTDEKIFGSEWWSNTGGKGETMNCRASIFPTNKTPSQMKLLMHPGKAQAEHRRRTLRRGNEAQSQTRAFIKKMNFLLLYMDAGSLDNKQEQMKSWPAVRKKWARDWTWKSLIPWCSDMKGRDGCNVSWKKKVGRLTSLTVINTAGKLTFQGRNLVCFNGWSQEEVLGSTKRGESIQGKNPWGVMKETGGMQKLSCRK